jgi:hypothetical protein
MPRRIVAMPDEPITVEADVEDSTPPLAPEAAPEVVDPSETAEREALVTQFDGLFAGTGGIDSWLRDGTPQTVVARLGELDKAPLTREQLTQLLVLSHEAGPSPAFFTYYWLSVPNHPYDVRSLPDFDPGYAEQESIASIAHLRWGLRRFYIDALLFFGNVRSAYRKLRDLSDVELETFFDSRRYDTEMLARRGPPLGLKRIARDDRYLVSEMACKSLAPGAAGPSLARVLRETYNQRVAAGKTTTVSVRQLLEDAPETEQTQLSFAATELLADELTSLSELEGKVNDLIEKFQRAREAALQNTKLYLSMVEELDVYVATSMRSREDFREMANFCEEVFANERLADLDVRYFDPTMSAAEGHEDKGLIECLMVKSAKALIYYAGSKESFGKDAEAAMALSQGKPVVLYSPNEERRRFYRDVHPLGRLIDFRTGVANGWMVASTPYQVAELLDRILRNQMVYELEQAKPGYLRLKEALTDSVVRLQTNDTLLRETFWNYYHRDHQSPLREGH